MVLVNIVAVRRWRPSFLSMAIVMLRKRTRATRVRDRGACPGFVVPATEPLVFV